MVSSKNFKYKKWAEKINPPQHLTKNLFFKTKKSNRCCSFKVREKGLEPSRLYRHKILSLACLPIPAFPQVIRFSNQGDNQI